MTKAGLFIILAILLVGCAAESIDGSTNHNGSNQSSSNQTNQTAQHWEQNVSNVSDSQEINETVAEAERVAVPEYDFTNITTADGKLIVYYFYLPYCGACKDLRPEINRLEAAYTDVHWLEYDISSQNGALAYNMYAYQYNLSTSQRLVPQVLVNGTIITNQFNIKDRLEGVILNFTKG